MNTITNFAATIGIDWADQKHDICLRPADQSKTEHILLQQTPEAIHEWVAQLRRRFDNRPVAVAIETSRGPLLSALMMYDFIVLFPINPKALKSYRDAFKVSGAKDDCSDGMLLEEYVRLHRDKLRVLEPDTELTRKLAGLCEKRRHLVDERTRMVEQLHSLLKTYYPLAETLLGQQLTKPIAADFLCRWSDLESLQKASAQTVRAFFYKHNSRGHQLIEERLQAIKEAKALTNDQAIIVPARLSVLALARMLRPLHQSITVMEQEIERALDQHPDAPIFRSFPGAGPALIPRLLVAFGTNRQRFKNATEVAQFYGIAPVIRQSGNTKTVHMRVRCPKFGRQTFHENAGCAIKDDLWTDCYYEQYKDNHDGKHHRACRALSFKLIRIYFACWKNHQPYDANRYLQALQKHGSPLHKKLKLPTPATV